MKKINSNDYVSGYIVMKGKWLQVIDDSKTFDDLGGSTEISVENSIVLMDDKTPENEVIKNDTYQKLSREAKEVIQIILNTPSEILEIIATPKLAKIKPEKLRDYLHMTYSKRVVRRIYRELKRFTSSF